MTGYHNYSKSNNAINAESNGLYPLSIAKKIVAKNTNLSQRTAKTVLKSIGYEEYHHTSKKYNITYYYDTKKAINIIAIADMFNLEPTDSAFLRAADAWDLGNDYERFLSPEMDSSTGIGKPDTTQKERFQEFVNDVKNNVW